jgi:SAM-dependent methyltransferase
MIYNFISSIIKPRWRAAWRYLRFSDNIIKWRFSHSLCPSCHGKFFISLRSDAFMTRCLSCGANATNLPLIPVIKEHASKHQIKTVWEMSTYGATLNYLKLNYKVVFESEYFPNKNPGEIVDGVLNEGVQDLSFATNSLDLITSNQVFEHVPDDIKGYRECYHVLKKNGALIFSVPLCNMPKTEQLAAVNKNKIIYYTEPEYHDSRKAGPHSILTFWRHSEHDIVSRVEHAGFKVMLKDVTIAPSQKIAAKVIYAIKP